MISLTIDPPGVTCVASAAGNKRSTLTVERECRSRSH